MLEMKVLAIGDPHGNIEKIGKIPIDNIDIILLTGDLGKADLARKRLFENVEREKQGLEELEEDKSYVKEAYMEIHSSTIDILKYLSRHAPVYTIQGNVGIPTASHVRKYRDKYGISLPATRDKINSMKNVYLVKNRVKVVNGLRIGFLEFFTDTNWVSEFKPSDYRKIMRKAKKQTDKARRILSRFDNGLDIFLFHQPPYGYLDKVGNPAPKHWRGKHAGSKVILEYIKKHQPRYAFCGHIHEGEGFRKIGKTEVYNLGVCGYKVIEF